MSKELPYFRFTVAEWLNDDISLESYHLQGVFASVCAFYWFQDCSITKAKLKKRFSDAQEEVEELLKLGIIKENKDDFISIKFLDEQFDMLSEKRQKRVEAGRKGGLASSKQRLSNAKAKPKQSSSYKDKDKDKDKDKSDSTASIPPDKEDVEDYFRESKRIPEKHVPLEAEKFLNHYDELEWKTNKGKGKKISNWKRQAGTWTANYKQWNGKEDETPKVIDGGYW